MLFRQMFVVILFCVFCRIALADTECPAGYHPAEYIELEYIKSTGTQYIDTGIIPGGKKIGMFLDFRLTVAASQTQISASFTSDGEDNFQWSTFNGKWRWKLANASGYGDACDTLRHTVYFNTKLGVKLDGISLTSVQYMIPASNQRPIYLFNRNGSSGIMRGKIYSAMYYDYTTDANGIVVANFIPAKRINDGKVGMYDTVTQTFFTNAGTDEFITGPEVRPFITDKKTDWTCVSCPANTYKDFVGNSDCTPCPTGTFSPIGSKNLSDCARILHVGNYMAYMPVGRRTEHGLCTMMDGVKYCADLYEKE